MRDSFIFYRSFYDAIKELPRDVQGEIYTAIMEYSLYGKETEGLKSISRSIFTLIKPQIDVNNKRFENGSKGGRPKKETEQKPNDNQTVTKEEPNNNVNVNDNVNVSSLSLAYAQDGLESIKSELRTNQSWREVAMMSLKIPTKDSLDALINEFFLDVAAKEKHLSNDRDAKEYFVNWYKYRPKQNENGTNSRGRARHNANQYGTDTTGDYGL